MSKQQCPALHVRFQEEDSNRVQVTVEVNQGNPWCCLLREKVEDASRTVRGQSTQNKKKQMWGLNESAYNGMNAFRMEKADDVHNQGKIYSGKQQNIFSDSDSDRNERKHRLYKNPRKNY